MHAENLTLLTLSNIIQMLRDPSRYREELLSCETAVRKDASCGRGKDVRLFQKDQIISIKQSKHLKGC